MWLGGPHLAPGPWFAHANMPFIEDISPEQNNYVIVIVLVSCFISNVMLYYGNIDCWDHFHPDYIEHHILLS